MIDWVTKQRAREEDNMLVTITIYKDHIIQVYFHKNSIKKITSGNHVLFGIDSEQHRMYFQAGTSVNGYKLQHSKTANGGSYIKSKTNNYVKEIKRHVGVYDLLFDEEQKLYYIQLAAK